MFLTFVVRHPFSRMFSGKNLVGIIILTVKRTEFSNGNLDCSFLKREKPGDGESFCQPVAIGGGWDKGNIHFDILKGRIGRVLYLKTSGIHIKIAHHILREPVLIKVFDRDIMVPGMGNTPGKKEHKENYHEHPAGAFHGSQIRCFIFVLSYTLSAWTPGLI
jgi:hypothetical protein